MVVLWIVLALIVVLVAGAAVERLLLAAQGFPYRDPRPAAASKTKVRVRIDPEAMPPADPRLVDQDWVRMRDLDEPDQH